MPTIAERAAANLPKDPYTVEAAAHIIKTTLDEHIQHLGDKRFTLRDLPLNAMRTVIKHTDEHHGKDAATLNKLVRNQINYNIRGGNTPKTLYYAYNTRIHRPVKDERAILYFTSTWRWTNTTDIVPIKATIDTKHARDAATKFLCANGASADKVVSNHLSIKETEPQPSTAPETPDITAQATTTEPTPDFAHDHKVLVEHTARIVYELEDLTPAQASHILDAAYNIHLASLPQKGEDGYDPRLSDVRL